MFVLGCGVAITLFGFPLVTRSFRAPVCGRPSVSHCILYHFFHLIVTFEAHANGISLCRHFKNLLVIVSLRISCLLRSRPSSLILFIPERSCMCCLPNSPHSFDSKQVATASEAEKVKGDGKTEALAPSLAEKFEIPTNTEVMVLSL